MIRGDRNDFAIAAPGHELGAVRECRLARFEGESARVEHAQHCGEGNSSEADRDRNLLERVELVQQVAKAVPQLPGRRFVLWRSAARRRSNEAVEERQTVIAVACERC